MCHGASWLLVGSVRVFAAYWLTVFAAAAFMFACVVSLQGIAALLLPRRLFLRVSGVLQMAAFAIFLAVYFLEPSLPGPRALADPATRELLERLPSYWFLGLFQQLNGSAYEPMLALARRALWR